MVEAFVANSKHFGLQNLNKLSSGPSSVMHAQSRDGLHTVVTTFGIISVSLDLFFGIARKSPTLEDVPYTRTRRKFHACKENV